MDFGWLKKYMPRSLFGRAILIMLFPMIGLQLVVGQVFIQRHFQRVTEQMAYGVALELNFAIDQVERAETLEQAQAALDEISINLEMLLLLSDNPMPAPGASRQFFDVSGKALIGLLMREIDLPLFIDLQSEFSRVDISIETGKGTLEVLIARSRVTATNPHQLLVLMILVSIILMFISIAFLRLQVRPIKRLAQAADAFGKGQHVALHPSGSTEIRQASLAFISMRNKLEQQFEERTKMLSAVSHDLRTPLTRMKLAVEMMADTDELQQDIEDMEAMLADFLAFARDDHIEEGQPVDPAALLAEVAGKAGDSSKDVEVRNVYESSNRLPVIMKQETVRRALHNLIENALHHGNTALFQMILTRKFLEYRIEDDGPGIPKDQRAAAMQPFIRLDSARNPNQRGVGLGLSIAADIAKGHGGRLVISKSSALGGLCASFRIPR